MKLDASLVIMATMTISKTHLDRFMVGRSRREENISDDKQLNKRNESILYLSLRQQRHHWQLEVEGSQERNDKTCIAGLLALRAKIVRVSLARGVYW